MARHTYRSYPRDDVETGALRTFGESIQERPDEAADYIEHLEDELSQAQERIEKLDDQVRDLEAVER